MDEERTVTTPDGHELACVLTGPSNPGKFLVMSHGITTDRDESGFFVALAAKFAAAGWGVLRFDFRGHGRSSGTPEDVTLSGELIDVLAVRKGFGLDTRPVAHLAASFGAGATLHSAEHLPVSRLVLINPILDYAGIFVRGESEWGEKIVASARELDGTGSTVFARLPDSRYVISRRLREEIGDDDTLDLVRRSAVPTLLLHGDADPLVPVDPARRLTDCRDSLRVVIYPGARHGLKAVRPAATATILEWLSTEPHQG